MSYTPPFIPRADSAFRGWAESFCNGLDASPGAFMFTPAQTRDLMRRFNEFNAAYDIAVAPATRTRSTIIAKQDARSILQHLIQQYAADIRCNDGITDGDKISIGVRPRNIAHNRRTCPGTSPVLSLIGTVPGVDQLFFLDPNTMSRAKPYGVERVELWVAYSQPGAGVKPPKKSEAVLIGSFKKNPMRVSLDNDRDMRMEGTGKPWYWARWVGFDNRVGPWSLRQGISSGNASAANGTTKPIAVEPDEDDQSLRLAA